MIRLRSTANCTNTPRVLYALEEMGVPYQIEVVRDGLFTATYGIPGPELTDPDGYIVLENNAVLRHVARRFGAGTLWPADLHGQAEVDRWLDFQAVRVSRAAGTRDLATLLTLLGALDQHLAQREWLLGDRFTVADCGFVPMLQKRAALPIDERSEARGGGGPTGFAGGAGGSAPRGNARHPNVAAYLDRLAARPAWARAQANSPR